MVLFIVGDEVNDIYSTTKTKQLAQKQCKEVRTVNYHTSSIGAHVTPRQCLQYSAGMTLPVSDTQSPQIVSLLVLLNPPEGDL